MFSEFPVVSMDAVELCLELHGNSDVTWNVMAIGMLSSVVAVLHPPAQQFPKHRGLLEFALCY